MKKILSALVAVMMFAGASQAQKSDSIKNHRKHGGAMMAKQLNLSEEQQAKLKSIREEQRKELQAINKKYSQQAQATFTPVQKEQLEKMKAERKARFQEGKKKFRKGGMKKGSKGAKHFKKSAEFQNQMNFTDQQKESMAQLRKDAKAEMEAIRADKTLNDDQKKQKMKDLMKAQKEKMKGIFTPEQVEKMKSLKEERKAGKTK